MKKWRSILSLATLLVTLVNASANAALDESKAIWSQVDKLVCRGEFSENCNQGECIKEPSKIVWEINFQTNKINFLTMDYSQDIQGRYFNYYESIQESTHVIYSQGRAITFELGFREGLFAHFSDTYFQNEFEKFEGHKTATTFVNCFYD